MVTLVGRCARRDGDQADGSASKIPAALGGIGLAIVSTALMLAACCEPPRGFDENAYFLTLSGAFLAGVAQVGTAVWVYDDVRGRRAAGKKFLYASIAPFAVAVGLWIGGFTA